MRSSSSLAPATLARPDYCATSACTTGRSFCSCSSWAETGRPDPSCSPPVDLDHSTGSKSLWRMRESGLLTREPAEHDRRVMRVLLTDKGRTMRQPLEEMWPALEWASVTDLDAVKQFMVTSAVIRREIVEHCSSAYIQPLVTDGGGQTHNQKEEVQI